MSLCYRCRGSYCYFFLGTPPAPAPAAPPLLPLPLPAPVPDVPVFPAPDVPAFPGAGAAADVDRRMPVLEESSLEPCFGLLAAPPPPGGGMYSGDVGDCGTIVTPFVLREVMAPLPPSPFRTCSAALPGSTGAGAATGAGVAGGAAGVESLAEGAAGGAAEVEGSAGAGDQGRRRGAAGLPRPTRLPSPPRLTLAGLRAPRPPLLVKRPSAPAIRFPAPAPAPKKSPLGVKAGAGVAGGAGFTVGAGVAAGSIGAGAGAGVAGAIVAGAGRLGTGSVAGVVAIAEMAGSPVVSDAAAVV